MRPHLVTFPSHGAELARRRGALQLGVGFNLGGALRVEATWLNQQLLRGDGSQRESGNGLLLALSSNASLR
jgi:hypothetical protein